MTLCLVHTPIQVIAFYELLFVYNLAKELIYEVLSYTRVGVTAVRRFMKGF